MLRHLSEAEGDTPDSYCLLNGKVLGAKWEIGDMIRDIKGGYCLRPFRRNPSRIAWEKSLAETLGLIFCHLQKEQM